MISKICSSWLLLVSIAFSTSVHAAPNFVVIFCDDLGYGDLRCFGNPTIKTPNLDRMAEEGQKWTQFYCADPVCTPSRAGILTGRYPIRSGMTSASRAVLFPDSSGGLPQEDVTIAELLKQKNYATAAVGKWHLGHLPQHLPMTQGFDSYFGIPYSNDMDRVEGAENYHKAADDPDFYPNFNDYNVPLLSNEKEIERPTIRIASLGVTRKRQLSLSAPTKRSLSSFTWLTRCLTFPSLHRKTFVEKASEVSSETSSRRSTGASGKCLTLFAT